MHSLLATLAELRILLLTVFLSGAVHYAIFDGGWWLDSDPAALGGQSIAITVAAPRPLPQPAIEPAEAEAPEPVVEQQQTVVAEPRPVITSAGANPPVRQLSPEPVQEKPEPEKVAELKPQSLPQPVQEPVQETRSEETEPETPVDSGQPLFQQHPHFLSPPQPPRYPRLARKRGIEGEVMLQVDLNASGTIIAIAVAHSSGSSLLDKAALKAVQRWQFAPAYSDGIAVASYVRIPVNFVLE